MVTRHQDIFAFEPGEAIFDLQGIEEEVDEVECEESHEIYEFLTTIINILTLFSNMASSWYVHKHKDIDTEQDD